MSGDVGWGGAKNSLLRENEERAVTDSSPHKLPSNRDLAGLRSSEGSYALYCASLV